MMKSNDIEDAVSLARNELLIASERFGTFGNAHEGIAVIREEYLELEHEVFHGSPENAFDEAIQLAAMALRFMVDISLSKRGEDSDG